MSVTATANPTTSAVLQVLTDYDLHHTGSPEPSGPAPAPNAHDDAVEREVPNPPTWPSSHRRVPHYRPINRHLDMEQRPGGVNGPEAVFIFTMLSGCRINSTVNRTWRATLGRLNEKWFRYEIGGEW